MTFPWTRSGAPGKLAEELFEHLVQHTLQARRSCATTRGDRAADPGAPGNAGPDREVGPLRQGFELGTAYSELVDPVVQRERLVAQSLLAAGGDPRRCSWTRISCAPWSTECRRPAAWEWESTGS
jgi:hypothetical protein